MKAKGMLTIGLLGFVAASVATMVWKEVRTAPVATPGARDQADRADVGPKLLAYYLHGQVRCVTCNDIEATAREAVESGFPEELESGRIEWRVVNYEEPGNEHYAPDFRLAAPCVVLASVRDRRQESWRSLPEVWELIGDKPALRAFVQQSIREELAGVTREEVASAPALQAVDLALPTRVAATPPLPRLLDIGSTRCIPCQQMAPILEDLRDTHRDRLEVVFIDILEDSDAIGTYGVTTIPTQIFFDASGKELFRHEGFFSREEILTKWRELGVDLETGTKS